MHVCLFDIDGTLISSGGAGKAAMLAAMESAFGVSQMRDGVPFSGRTDRAIARDLFQVHGIAPDAANWQRFVASYLDSLPRCLHTHSGKVLPGISRLLELLQARPNVVVGLLTGNLREGARIKLSHYGLYHHFPFGGFGDQHYCRNEVAREAVQALESHLRGPANSDRLWVIGDTPLDVQCARAIGARVAAVCTGLHSSEELAGERPDLLFTDLSDPSPLLALLA
jgi:phosphoglycolate phosphatase-like HAD superfamily hydrolase